MPLVINTSSPEDRQALRKLRDVIQLVRPRLARYYECTREQQQEWRDRDPLLNRLLTMVERLSGDLGGPDE